MVNPLTYKGKIHWVTKRYKRSSGTTTKAQKKSVQGIKFVQYVVLMMEESIGFHL